GGSGLRRSVKRELGGMTLLDPSPGRCSVGERHVQERRHQREECHEPRERPGLKGQTRSYGKASNPKHEILPQCAAWPINLAALALFRAAACLDKAGRPMCCSGAILPIQLLSFQSCIPIAPKPVASYGKRMSDKPSGFPAGCTACATMAGCCSSISETITASPNAWWIRLRRPSPSRRS